MVDLDLLEDENNQEEFDPDKESTIFARVLKNYDNRDELQRTQYHLQESFRSGALICLICIDNVERNQAIWSCEKCYAGFHLDCIQKWAKDNIFFQLQQAEESGNNARSLSSRKSITWSCPKCRFEYLENRTPQYYKCFCGKTNNPPFDPWLIPHSCGEKCMKILQPQCGHSCLLLCHPGPCPPCPVMVKNLCYCSRTSATRRCASKFWSCQKVCNRLLNCKQHKCTSICHEGACPPCLSISQQKCQCGARKETRPCSDLIWQCNKVCNRKYSCGHHTCLTICHKGPCGECPDSKERTCPCGKQSSILPCTEVISSCGDSCSKPLACQVHFCAERCHRGQCPSCLQVLTKKCQCGLKEKELPCSKLFICDVKCKRMRDCKKHSCNRKCCTGDCPPCEHPCGKTLGCGQHKCESRCHRGRCFPCSITHTISCSCGKASIVVPCGREKKTPLPRCDSMCQKPSNCHHNVKDTHTCHEGRCPRCKIKCGLGLPCGHKCLAQCHDAVPLKIVENFKPAGPWEVVKAPSIKISKLPCPPCKISVPGICFGKHETSNWACSDLRPHSCGRKCGRKLLCGHHTCEKECHTVEGTESEVLQGTNCQDCQKICSQERPKGCNHHCKRSCHPGKCDLCLGKVQVKCHCGLLKMTFDCHLYISSNNLDKEKMQSCASQCSKSIKCGHSCRKICHSGNCSSPSECRKKLAVRCPCKRLKKEFPCHLIASGNALLKCDEVCEELANERKKKLEENEIKKQKEEELRREKELEEFERMMTGKKKKRKKENQNSDNDYDSWKIYYFIFGSIFVVALSIFYLYL